MIAISAKKLLQIIIGTGQIGNAVAVKQAWPVAPADLQKVPDRWCEAPGFGWKQLQRNLSRKDFVLIRRAMCHNEFL
jgi:hypothetical protein